MERKVTSKTKVGDKEVTATFLLGGMYKYHLHLIRGKIVTLFRGRDALTGQGWFLASNFDKSLKKKAPFRTFKAASEWVVQEFGHLVKN